MDRSQAYAELSGPDYIIASAQAILDMLSDSSIAQIKSINCPGFQINFHWERPGPTGKMLDVGITASDPNIVRYHYLSFSDNTDQSDTFHLSEDSAEATLDKIMSVYFS